jgi:hypothetical protein
MRSILRNNVEPRFCWAILELMRTRPANRPLAVLTHLIVAMAIALASLLPTRAAWAVDRDVKAILVGGGYGLVGGTLLGAVSLPFTQDLRSVFIGTSVGLYLGLAVGVYYVLERDREGNPLRQGAAPAADGASAARESRGLEPSESAGFKALVQVQVPVFRF